MRHSAIASLALAVSSVAVGCAAPAEEDAPSELSSQTQGLTLEECGTQLEACFAENPLFGVFTCPAQYNQCTVTASNGLPSQVIAAVGDSAECAQKGLDCLAGATTPAQNLVCTTAEADCVAEIVGVDLPEVVPGTAACVAKAESCIAGAKRPTDLAVCGEDLGGCAVEQLTTLVPEEVVAVIGDVSECQVKLEACITAATTASALTKCTEDGAKCVAESLDVTLPNVPVSDFVACTEKATACTLDASTIRELNACETALNACAAEAVSATDVPAELSCEQKWTACLAKNPFDFFTCGAELAACQD